MPTRLDTPAQLLDLVGEPIGVSDWYELTQHQVNQFADATRDHQWIHVNPNQAADGPFGGPIAHGFLTLSMAQQFLADVLTIETLEARLNYGLNKVRFTAPVPVGAQIRGSVTLLAAEQKPSGIEAAFSINVELRGSDRPAMIAESVVIYR